MTHYNFCELVDVEKLQELMERFYAATGIPVGIIDVEGNIHVATGWQDICNKFHRIHPETLARCRQSDAFIQDNLHTGSYIEYKCGNGLWDLAVPLVIAGDHLATLFLGQFFYADEDPDLELFRSQAREFGFDEEIYLASLARVPVFTREKIKNIMDYYTCFVRFLMENGVTNRRRIEMERDLRRSNEQLLHSQKMEAVGQLAGGVAHDFNNILTAIIGFASLMHMKMEEANQLRHYADQIISAAEKAAGLTQSLLAFSKKQIMDPHPLDLNQAIQNVRKLLRRLLREDIEFVTNLCPEPITVMADRIHFEQVLMNLVSNAGDAMSGGGAIFIGTEELSIDEEFINIHGYGSPGRYACISISDTGVGMDQQTREKIFEPYFTTKEQGKGTGLGLATVYGIIKQHDGYINVYSESGHGTTFKIYLPILALAEHEQEKTAAPYPRGGIETVLLVEDSEYVRESNRELLENFGYRVIEAIDGEDAINKFAIHKDEIDLMILDVIMPKKCGKEVYDTVKEIRADIKALFTSGYASELITQQGLLDDKLHYIAKPIAPRELLKKIRELLSS